MSAQHALPACLEADGAMQEQRIRRNTWLTLEKLRRLCRRNRRGAAAVEFAVVAPVFFAFTLGMVEIGRGVMVQQIITTASREGARQAVLDGATQSSINTFVTTMLTNASVTAAGTTVAISPSLPLASGYNGPVTVTVSLPFNQVSWSPSPIFLNGATLTASTTMQSQGLQ
jgi:Flp pilus assembly protein TadG